MWKRLLPGSVKFSVQDEGVNLLNRLRKFDLYDVTVGESGLTFSTPLGNKSAIKQIIGKRTHTAVDSNNIFSVANFLYTRAALVMTAVICLTAFIVLDQFAFRVRLNGLEGTEYSQVSAFLNERGVNRFVPKRVAKDGDLAFELVNRFDFVAHANISVRGSTITVQIHRADNVAGDIQTGDIVSTHDGVIAEIIVFSGTANVQRGDVVTVGEVLVTGNRPTAIIKITNGTEIVAIINSFEN